MRYLAYYEEKSRGTFDFPIELHHVDPSHLRYEMPFHWHMESEAIHIIRGSFHLIANGETVCLQAGDSAFIPTGIVHGGYPKDCIYVCIVFDSDRFFQDGTVCRQRFQQTFSREERPLFLLPAGSSAGYLLQDLFAAMGSKPVGYEFIVTGLLWKFMGLLLQQASHNQTSCRPKHLTGRMESIKYVLQRIRTDYHKSLDLKTLAAYADMSPQYFCRIFRTITGRTPIDYLNYYRIECAAEMLRSTEENITEIALSCGFGDSAYFSRMFHKCKGMSPSKFRTM